MAVRAALVAFVGVGLGVAASTAQASQLSSHNAAYVFDDSQFPCGSSGCGMNDTAFPGGSVFTNAFGIQPGTGDTGTYTPAGGTAVSLTNVPISALDSNPHALDSFDTAILYEPCKIGDSGNRPAIAQVNSFLSAVRKVIILDADACAPSADGTPDWSGFVFPFTTNNPGPVGAQGSYGTVEPSSLTTGLAPGPVPGDAVGDANIFTTSDRAWFRSIEATNTNGVNGIVEAYARTSSGGLALYEGEDFWYTSDGSAHLSQVFDDLLNQQWDPDKLPSSSPAAGTPPPTRIPPTTFGLPPNKTCIDRRKFAFHFRRPVGYVVKAQVFVNNVPVQTKRGAPLLGLKIKKLPNKGRFKVKIIATQNNGTRLITTRTYTVCKKTKPKGHRVPAHHH